AHPGGEEDGDGDGALRKVSTSLSTWAKGNAALLDLTPDEPIEVAGLHPVFRVGRDGQLLVEVVFQLTQKAKTAPTDFGGVALRGGTPRVVQANGHLRYVTPKPLLSGRTSVDAARRASERVDRQRAFVDAIDEIDSFHIWKDDDFQKTRLRRLTSLARLH